ncbi:MAG: DUF4157 domain-containing protein [Bacteroidota bacterium]
MPVNAEKTHKTSADISNQNPIPGEHAKALPAVPVLQASAAESSPPSTPDNNGMPGNLKAGIENLSGIDLSDVKVHYNSAKPAQLQAHAFAQGSDIHIAPSQEKHLPHEAWHVVQQKQGRVKPTLQLKDGTSVNDDPALENEADVNSAEMTQFKPKENSNHIQKKQVIPTPFRPPVQRRIGIEAELTVPVSEAKGGAGGDAIVRNFLDRGGDYGVEVAAAANGYKKTVDHDSLGTEIANVHLQMTDRIDAFNEAQKAAGKAQVAPLPAFAGEKHGNMEYSTDSGAATVAYDEESDAEMTTFRASIKHMAADMQTVLGNAKAGGFQGLANGYQYGIPTQANWEDFCHANGIKKTYGASVYTALTNKMNNQLYLQVTAGVTPRKIADHLKKLGSNRRLSSLREQFPDRDEEKQWVGLLTTKAVTAAEAAIGSVNANLPGGIAELPRAVVRSSSLKGFVSLIMTYIFGFYFMVRRAGLGGAQVLGKNVVSSLSKVPLNQIQLEIDVAKRPDQWVAGQRNTLTQRIIASALAVLNGAPVNRVGADDAGANNMAGADWQAAWLPDVLKGNVGQDVFFDNMVGAKKALAPADHKQSKIIKTGAGRVNRNGGVKEKGGAIPMELRLVQEHPTPAQLPDLVNNAITHLRKTHGHWS